MNAVNITSEERKKKMKIQFKEKKLWWVGKKI